MTELAIHVPSVERVLRADFANMVGRLALPRLAAAHLYIPAAGQTAGHEPMEDYTLWPVLPAFDEDFLWLESTLDPAEYDNTIPGATARHCIHSDAEHAIALGFQGHVVAYAAAGISDGGTLRVVQLQGSAPDTRDPIAARGRRGGFLWTDTLVSAWAEIGLCLGLNVIDIEPPAEDACNHGNGPEHVEAIINKYIYTARRLNFDPPAAEGGTWRHSLPL